MYKIVSIFCFHCALRQWNLISVSSDFLFKENGQIGELKTKIEAGLRHYAVDDFDCQQLTEHTYVLRWHYTNDLYACRARKMLDILGLRG